MAKEINVAKMIVDNFEVKDIIAHITPKIGRIVQTAAEAVDENNISMLVFDASALASIYNVLKELDVKLNGDKPTNVL